MRTPAAEVRQTGRDSMGVRLVNLDEGAHLLSVTKNSEDEITRKECVEFTRGDKNLILGSKEVRGNLALL